MKDANVATKPTAEDGAETPGQKPAPPPLDRSALCLQTVYFHDSDRGEAARLGGDLYDRLTRPAGDPLAYGPGIPVRVAVQADRVNLTAAETNVIIPVLGKTSYLAMAGPVLRKLQEWHADLGVGKVLVVPTSANWRGREDELPGKQLLTMLYGKGDARRQTFDEIVLATARLWEPERANMRLFISHAKADIADNKDAAKKIHDYVMTDTTGAAFFDANDLRPGESLGAQLDKAVSRGVLIAVRGDAYSSRVWCQRELLLAKLHGMPTLSVEILRRGESRSSPYGGNSPSLVWNKNPARVVTQAMIEWLRAEFFRREARRIIPAANLPKDVMIVARPPELLDLAQGPLQSDRAQLVLHPDPELSALERRVLKAARPRLYLATPTSAFRRLLSRGDQAVDVSSPLEGMQVAMSLSDSPDEGGPDGFTEHHVKDATVHIARTLISAGAAIAYGGDFRAGGYTELLAQLIQTYNQAASKRAQDLHIYLRATLDLEAAPPHLPLCAHHLRSPDELAKEALLPYPKPPDAPPEPFYVSDMRRVMELHTEARVILGGNAEPRIKAGKKAKGYGGRYPGVVEEAWRALQLGHPLYVAGGFGGAAWIVAELLAGKEIPELLTDSRWMKHRLYKKNAATLDAHPARVTLGLPRRMEDLAEAIVKLGLPHLANDEASMKWNGLSVAENQLLFRTRDPLTLAVLVSKGLLRFTRNQDVKQLQIELVHDSLTAAEKLDAVAIATLDGVPLGGAGKAIDELTEGTVREARAKGETLVSLPETRIDANWLFLTSLGAMGPPADVLAGVERAARSTAERAEKQGFHRVGVITFGGNVLPGTKAVAQAMLAGFHAVPALRRRTVLIWYETDGPRFDRLSEVLGADPEVKLTTRRSVTRQASAAAAPDPLILNVRLENDQLSATCVPPSSSALVAVQGIALLPADLKRLSAGRSESKRVTPTLEALEKRGVELATLLFGEQAPAILAMCRDARLVVIHDTAASKVPFEMLLASPDLRPALNGGITRRLLVPGLKFEQQFSKAPKKGKLQVLLIVDPTEDLPDAAREAEAVKNILSQNPELVLTELWKKEATVKNVTAALAQADILHYCGHAFFDGPEPEQSGLSLAGDIPFTGAHLEKIESLPRMAFVNACEAGRVRGQPESEAAAFAELFLRSGVDAYLGTYWEVGDEAAALFATTVYTHLAKGDTLEQATLAGRIALFKADEADWANYILFGGGSFRLVTQA